MDYVTEIKRMQSIAMEAEGVKKPKRFIDISLLGTEAMKLLRLAMAVGDALFQYQLSAVRSIIQWMPVEIGDSGEEKRELWLNGKDFGGNYDQWTAGNIAATFLCGLKI